MTYQVARDFIGYGANPPDPQWPGGAKLAVNFVINFEEGSEPSFELGDGVTENGAWTQSGEIGPRSGGRGHV
jgi:allantoinase